jgi:hypothetical protein
MKYKCPVCGFDQLSSPPMNHVMCPCCGTEFGYHDCTRSHLELMNRWLAKGAPWFSKSIAPPAGWSWFNQLVSSGLIVVETGGQDVMFDDETQSHFPGPYTGWALTYQMGG